MVIKKYGTVLLLFLGIISCAEIAVGSIWTKFRQSEIVSKKTDQGPYGGTTEIHWNLREKISADEVMAFAKRNNWKDVDTTNADLNFSNQILKRRFDKTEIENKTVVYLKSNILTIDEDTNLETQINCFAIIDAQNHKMILYQLWGDF